MAEELKISIIGDASKLKSELEGASGHVSSFSEKIGSIGKTMTIVGGAVTAAFGMIIKKTADAGDAFNDMNLRTGVSVENLSTLAYVAKQSGTDIGGVELGLKFLTTAMNNAAEGNEKAIETFANLGVSFADADGKMRPVVNVMKDVATAISNMENPAEQSGVAMDLFGARSGTQLVPMLKLGGDAISELQGKAKDLGIEMSTASAQAADAFKDKMTDLTGSLAGVGRTIGEVLIPALTPLIEKATEIIGKIAVWAEENPKLVETITAIGVVVGVVFAVGGPILMAVSAISKIGGAINLLLGPTNPIGLLIIAIGAVVLIWKNWDTIVTFVSGFVENIKTYLGDLKTIAIQKVTEMIDWIIQKFEDIADLPRKMLQWGKDLITDFAQGIKDSIGKVTDAIKGIGTKILNFLKPGSATVEGPLSVGGGTEQWGYDLIENYALGINDAGPLVATAVENLATDTLSIFDTLLTDFETNFVKPFINKFVNELTPAIENFFFGIEGYESDWSTFWGNLWSAFKTYISNMIAKLLIAIPLMLVWKWITGGATWDVFKIVWGFLGFEKGGQVKGFASGGLGTDTVPTMLTPGEYVISLPMTNFIKKFKAIPQNLISAIAGGFPTPTPAFASGGSVGYSNINGENFGGNTIYVDIHDNKISDEIDIKHLAAKVSDEIVRKLSGRRRF